MQLRKKLIRMFFALSVLWLFLSGMFKPMQIGLGVISIVMVCYLSTRMNVLVHNGQPLYLRFRYLATYCIWLIVEILKSNIDVIKCVFHPSLPIDPVLKGVPSKQETELGRVVYANSITLTPGTVAINIAANGEVLVHALDKRSLDILENGTMGARVCQLEPITSETIASESTVSESIVPKSITSETIVPESKNTVAESEMVDSSRVSK